VGAIARRTRRVSAHDIELFTELTGDRNPLHYDEGAAGASRFGGLIVQGGITSGLLNAVVAEDLPGPGSVFLHVEWDFKAPVRPGDEITAEVEVLEAAGGQADHAPADEGVEPGRHRRARRHGARLDRTDLAELSV
jgi:acyl dehydratase